ncbi:hypothetical protein HO173_003564 [Letharia columbiana]|uniref:Uncharacterized protein n=1 Tax=Letharia columbiana TaxID=112416 RepID=A0A8H6G0N4_9LECA|nr:uncharacterized protein HO173_003564 [Letharia columbiana]KAF6238284.1 hypothetical protein HO173_003564 [Letharia columbiana]
MFPARARDNGLNGLTPSSRCTLSGISSTFAGRNKKLETRFTAHLDEPPTGFLQPLSGHLQPIEEFTAAIPFIYATTPETDRGLRGRAVEYGSNKWETLWAQPAFKHGLTEIGDFINNVVTEGW